MKRRWLRAMLCFAKGFVFCVFVFCFFCFVFWQGSWLRAMLCFDKGGVEECRELAGRDLSSRREEGIDTPCQVLCEICIWNIFCILSIWSPCQVLCCVKYLPYFKYLIWYLEYLKTSLQWGPRPSNSELTLISKKITWKMRCQKNISIAIIKI